MTYEFRSSAVSMSIRAAIAVIHVPASLLMRGCLHLN